MKIMLEKGDRVIVKDKFKSSQYAEEIQKLAGEYVTIRERIVRYNEYLIEETEGLNCDDYWSIDDFILNKKE